MKLELSYFLTHLLNILMERKNQNKVRIQMSKSFPIEISLTISTGIAPTNSDGIIKTKIIFIKPWNAPPLNKEGVRKKLKIPVVTWSESVKRKLVE